MTEQFTGLGLFPAAVGASTAWPTANTAFYYPVYLPVARTYTKAWWLNGATAAGNADVGIFTISGTTATLVVASTAQAQSGVSAMQVATTFTTTTLAPGLYYLATSASLATQTRWANATSSWILKAAGCFARASAHPLSTNGAGAVVVIGNSIVPVFGFSEVAAI